MENQRKHCTSRMIGLCSIMYLSSLFTITCNSDQRAILYLADFQRSLSRRFWVYQIRVSGPLSTKHFDSPHTLVSALVEGRASTAFVVTAGSSWTFLNHSMATHILTIVKSHLSATLVVFPCCQGTSIQNTMATHLAGVVKPCRATVLHISCVEHKKAISGEKYKPQCWPFENSFCKKDTVLPLSSSLSNVASNAHKSKYSYIKKS